MCDGKRVCGLELGREIEWDVKLSEGSEDRVDTSEIRCE